ncbi:hypothetical protein AGDE_06929 [Angomonas deanei]|uniref:Uncharacterized protein n=1 Tax=Angomonas deanei TaxID=59799 RepID=A0A7G2CR14_9TRYP|nr:hypothetical protein AGDE_06929 [Angomonas deanei]CAD2221441.1 Domain of unknown function (DUF4524), putative [Angomonas deanei]|eukprot:EPY36406.1 hypothetical protein AGDE_06929 [Angomonas deanei]
MIPLTTIKNTHFFPASVVEDQVVSACVWEDGGGEFVYGDGSLLSFADCMNTFVAFSPYIPASSTKENQARSSYYTEGQKVTSPKAEMERDMSFTAWALSKYKKKVMAALYLYNRYSVHPRVLVDYIPSPVEEWKLSSPIEALVLCKHRILLRRRKVYAVGHVAYTPEDEITFPSVQREARVPVGTQVTLWCALQRVSLTIHANRTTFSVRWPVPVEGTPASVKQRREALFCSLSESSINIAGGASVGSCGADLDLLLGKKKTYFTWMESVFPIDDPPEVWRVMLQMALELARRCP